jgi:hypothetical protein
MVSRIVKKETDIRRRDFEHGEHMVFSKSLIRITETSPFVKPEERK